MDALFVDNVASCTFEGWISMTLALVSFGRPHLQCRPHISVRPWSYCIRLAVVNERLTACFVVFSCFQHEGPPKMLCDGPETHVMSESPALASHPILTQIVPASRIVWRLYAGLAAFVRPW